jgi:hypothetical protein
LFGPAATIDKVSRIELGFPHDFLRLVEGMIYGKTRPLIDDLKGKAKKAIAKLHQRWEKARAMLAQKGKQLKLNFLKNMHTMHLKLKDMIAKVKEPAKEPAK